MEQNLKNEVSSEEIMKKNEESSLKIPLCRICYDQEKENNSFIHPCRCSGSVKYVHVECMKTWLLSSGEDLNNRACEVCHTTLLMRYRIVSYITCKDICKESAGVCLFVPILLAILGLIIVIIYFLSIKIEAPDSSKDDKIYSLSLIIGCSIAGIVIVIILCYICKHSLIQHRMEN